MKAIKTVYLLLLAVLVAACSSDSTTDDSPQSADGQTVRVGLRISAASSGTTRATAWGDTNAKDAEMMNIWTVVVVNNDKTSADCNKVVAIHACKPTTTDGGVRPEVDDYVELPTGTYRFYSFANMAPSVAMSLLGISGTAAKSTTPLTRADGDGGNDNTQGGPTYGGVTGYTPSNTDDILSDGIPDTVYAISYADGATVDTTDIKSKTVNVAGNGYDPETNNVYGAKGIPMCNVQTKVITSSTSFDIVVVRLIAKIELQIKNSTGANVTVNKVTLSNVTQNADGNLKLLPSMSKHDNKASTHQDIQPNLGTVTQDNMTVAVNKDITDGSTENVSFYVNESAEPSNAEKLFYLTLELAGSSGTEYRYALISNTAANEWNYIARNDYRVIPVTLDNLKFEVVPYDFPPIGVYPVSVKLADATNHIYDFEFHDYGHFHLLPVVTRGGTALNYADTPSGSDYQWSLLAGATDAERWANSWKTAATFGGAWLDSDGVIANGFYRTTGATDTDGDEVGSVPYWYANATGKPQWDPTASGNYQPFIFGYIAENTSGAQIYHEMRIQVYNGTTAYRQMLYRFYMTLSDSQLLSAPRRAAAPRRPHCLVTAP